MDSILRKFNGDIHTKEALLEYIHMCIADEGVRRIYAGEDVAGVKDARKLIDLSFEKLQDQYAIPDKQIENTNTAR